MYNLKLEEIIDYIESNKMHPTNEVYYRYILRFSEVYPITFLCSIFRVAEAATMNGRRIWANQILMNMYAI